MSRITSLQHKTVGASDPFAAELQAYNRAFLELELPWQWDAATYRALLANDAGDCVGAYIDRAQAHLLKTYDRAFLRDLIHATKSAETGSARATS
jgi:hypothetical protein